MAILLLGGASFGVLHCGGSTVATPGDDGGAAQDGAIPADAYVPYEAGPPPPGLPPPADHRPVALSCSATRPAGYNAAAGVDAGNFGACAHDSECTAGKNGRCLPPQHNGIAHSCNYDACTIDDDCGAGNVCLCGATLGINGSDGTPMRDGNRCVASDCRIDGDCGKGGFCSPTFDTSCGPYSGVQGYDCHTPHDACTNDDQCKATSPQGYCAWQPTLGKWACSNSACAG